MSLFCWISTSRLPAPTAWRRPAGKNIASPAFTPIVWTSSAAVPDSSAFLNSLRAVCLRNPTNNSALSSAAAMYQNSVLGSLPNFAAILSGGCTCKERRCCASSSFRSNGNRGLSGSAPKISCRSWVQSSCNVFPRIAPLRTTLCASLRSTISHDSPMHAFGGNFFPNFDSSRRPPHIRSIKIGWKVRGPVRLG